MANKALHRTAIPLRSIAAGDRQRVCRAWHRASEVQVLGRGIGGGEGKEKGKGVIARWGLEEAQSKHAGRRTGTR